ncbi:putative membrane protein YagU involved in acid resistance [Virgibacillus natechei]|uniref:Membrane protein YagU involved in acid resistance n=1 Tax=Virgibacillus natechei TaxID=1216297 RepID=A0ABS4IFM5_9BACI|nr:YqhR family membrane protein [Virgibacillus natechei]MBP1969723.1 putative membrane protein YagU involved in acid resistance [Virgibacillus natechei]UZD11448.1 YqhR family membrane protein [Virgibacillus natechei]
MSEKNIQLEQDNNEESMSILSRTFITGFVGGLIGSLFGIIMYYFNFSEVSPKSYVLRAWTTLEWTEGWLGDLVSIFLVGIISIAVAFIYYGILKKINSMWMGVAYGGILWGILFIVLQPIFTNVPPVMDLDINTIVSTLCLFIIYGTFIGYSISYDYHDMKLKEKKQEQQQANGN